MRIKDFPLTDLLQPATSPSVLPRPALPVPGRNGRDVARENEFRCLKAVSEFGHLRINELARAGWPSANYAEQLARRTAGRLLDAGLLAERKNALGSRSLCLTRGGAAWLEDRGVPARHTLDLSSVAGATFIHRTLATRYLIERSLSGHHVAGEYRILRKALPFSIDAVAARLGKAPDGLVWFKRGDGSFVVDFVEVEAARKARGELERALRWNELAGTVLPGAGRFVMSGLTFVFDASLNHARRIALAADCRWSARPLHERASLEQRVKLVAVKVRDPLVWEGSTTTTLHELRRSR